MIFLMGFLTSGRTGFRAGRQAGASALAALLLVALHSGARGEYLEDLDRALSYSAFEGRVRLRLSGTLDLETYAIDHPAPALIYTKDDFLFNPRLTVYLDANITR